MAKQFKPKKRIGRPPDPDADWNVPPPDAGAMRTQCVRILQKIKDAPAEVWQRAISFFEDVERKVREIATALEQGGAATPGQQKALNGWEGGVDKWLRPKGGG